MREVRALAITVAKEGCEGAVRQALENLIEPGNKEAGVIQYELHVDTANPRQFVFVERWESEEAFEAHCNGPQIPVYWAAVEGMIERADVILLSKLG